MRISGALVAFCVLVATTAGLVSAQSAADYVIGPQDVLAIQVFDQPDLAAGSIGFVSQSGAVGTAITALAHAEQVGIGYFLSTGNEGDLEFSDFCDFFAGDPRVEHVSDVPDVLRSS